jgi:hypothetical protein
MDATPTSAEVKIRCSISLAAGEVIDKRLILEGTAATGVVVDCNGAVIDGGPGSVNQGLDMIEIRSEKQGNSRYDRPENVTVRECTIYGSVRILGMAKNGEGPALLSSSYLSGHVSRARANAPTGVTLDHLTIIASGRTPLYFAPGVTSSVLRDSELRGRADGVALYLDAESAYNTLRDNYIHTVTAPRELIAVDGSSYNRIIDNRFSALDHGGIYFYRNCGEAGTVRHSTPSHNTVVNNVFYYDKYTGSKPSIYLGSRNGVFSWFNPTGKTYCNQDHELPFDNKYGYGSAISDLDYAQYNIVMQNQVYKRSIADMIRTGGTVNVPNFIDDNETVTAAVDRPAGCPVLVGEAVDFVLDGGTILLDSPLADTRYRCSDGDLIPVSDPADQG